MGTYTFHTDKELDDTLTEINYKGLMRKVARHGKSYGIKQIIEHVLNGGCNNSTIIRYKQDRDCPSVADRFFITDLGPLGISKIFSDVLEDNLSCDTYRVCLMTVLHAEMIKWLEDHKPTNNHYQSTLWSEWAPKIEKASNFDAFFNAVKESKVRFSLELERMLYNFESNRHLFTEEDMKQIDVRLTVMAVNNE